MSRAVPGRDERGAVAVELVVVVPALVVLIGLLVAGGRFWLASQAVEEAASAGARAASLARDPGAARTRAAESVRANLDTQGVRCRPLAVDVDTAGFARAPGLPAEVGTSVRCTVSLADVAVPGLPGQLTVSADGGSALDTFRSR